MISQNCSMGISGFHIVNYLTMTLNDFKGVICGAGINAEQMKSTRDIFQCVCMGTGSCGRKPKSCESEPLFLTDMKLWAKERPPWLIGAYWDMEQCLLVGVVLQVFHI